MGSPETSAGWYPDPDDHDRERWWDGYEWSDRVRAYDGIHNAGDTTNGPPIPLPSHTGQVIVRRSAEDLFSPSDRDPLRGSRVPRPSIAQPLNIDRTVTALASGFTMVVMAPAVLIGWGLILFLPALFLFSWAMYPSLTSFRQSRKPWSLHRWAPRRGFTMIDPDRLRPDVDDSTPRRQLRRLNGYQKGHQTLPRLSDIDVPVANHGKTGVIGDVAVGAVAHRWCSALTYFPPAKSSPAILVCFRLPQDVAARFPGVSVRYSSGLRGSEPPSTVQLESRDLDNVLSIGTHPEQDEVAFRELFGPQLIHELSVHPIEWDQRGTALVFFIWRTPGADGGFEEFIRRAFFVYEHYLSEHQ